MDLDIVLRSIFNTVGDYASRASVPGLLDRYDLERQYEGSDKLWFYGNSEEYQFEVSEQAPPRFRRFQGRQAYPKPSIVELDDVQLVGSEPIPIQSNRIIVEGIVRERILLLHLFDLLRSSKMAVFNEGEVIDAAILLYNKWNDGYFHWVTENLTRLRALEKYSKFTGRRPKIIVGPSLSSWQLESLKLLGYRESDLVRRDSDNTRIKTMIVPSNPRKLHSSWTWVSNKMKSNIDRQYDGLPTRIYISREDSEQRMVVNETDLMTELRPYGFKKVVPGELTVKKQVALFSEANIVIGPHGAGLTNLIHSKKPLTLIELFSSEDIRGQYFNICKKLGYNHDYVLGDPRGKNIKIEIDEVIETLSHYI